MNLGDFSNVEFDQAIKRKRLPHFRIQAEAVNAQKRSGENGLESI